MSRIGKLPVVIPANVEIKVDSNLVVVKGPKGELKQDFEPEFVNVAIEEGNVIVTRLNDSKTAKSRHGLYRSLIANMIEGSVNGFTKSLEIRGVGYRGKVNGSTVELNLGYSHPINYAIPEGIVAEFDKEQNNVLHINGINKQLVGQVASNIRSFRKPEPYKGKGIRYVGEHVAMKAGKSAAK